MKIYLAYPIDQSNGAPYSLGVAKAWLRSQSWVTWMFDPGEAFSVGQFADRDSSIRETTGAALSNADVVLAFIPAGAVSVGVPMEIERATLMGKPAVVVSDAPSWMLEFGAEDPEGSARFAEFEDAKQHLVSLLDVVGGSDDSSRAPMPVVLSEGAEIPRRGFSDDAGLDLVVSEDRVVNPGDFVDIPCGVRAELPAWSWGLITGRSSTLRNRGLMVSNGVIDAGYRGQLFAGVWNLTDEPVRVSRGERVAQLILIQNATALVEPVQVSHLTPGTRGSAGFGSTGA